MKCILHIKGEQEVLCALSRILALTLSINEPPKSHPFVHFMNINCSYCDNGEVDFQFGTQVDYNKPSIIGLRVIKRRQSPILFFFSLIISLEPVKLHFPILYSRGPHYFITSPLGEREDLFAKSNNKIASNIT